MLHAARAYFVSRSKTTHHNTPRLKTTLSALLNSTITAITNPSKTCRLDSEGEAHHYKHILIIDIYRLEDF